MEENLQEHHLVKLKGNEFVEFFSLFQQPQKSFNFIQKWTSHFVLHLTPDVSFLTIRSCNCQSTQEAWWDLSLRGKQEPQQQQGPVPNREAPHLLLLACLSYYCRHSQQLLSKSTHLILKITQSQQHVSWDTETSRISLDLPSLSRAQGFVVCIIIIKSKTRYRKLGRFLLKCVQVLITFLAPHLSKHHHFM